MNESAKLRVELLQSRSPWAATTEIEQLIEVLRNGTGKVPRHLRPFLADALQRVLDENNAVTFMCGKKSTRGREKRDKAMLAQVYAATMWHRHANKRKLNQALEAATEQLKSLGVYIDVDTVEEYHEEARKLIEIDRDFYDAVSRLFNFHIEHALIPAQKFEGEFKG